MTKIMLVEDDKNLREIYGVRLLAEGYEIVTAGDGEEALAMAVKEKPSLIIADIMMPRISGFDMLDILRSTNETRDVKVIVMTALSSEDQRRHGEALGADLYLVKSQVGIEDVVHAIHGLLGDKPAAPAASAPMAPPPAAPAAAPPVPAATTPVGQPASDLHTAMPPISSSAPAPASARQRIIQPINSPVPAINLNELLDRELARETGTVPGNPQQPGTPTPPPAQS
jgi:CheY-like chemotaxis protein